MIGIPSRAPAGADGLQPHDWIDPSPQTANTGRWLRVGTRRGPGSSRRLPFRRRHRASAAQPLRRSSRPLAGLHFAPCGHHRMRTSRPQIASYRPQNVRARTETNLTATTPMLPRQRRMAGCFSYPPASPVVVFLIISSGISRIQPSRRVGRTPPSHRRASRKTRCRHDSSTAPSRRPR